MPTKDGFTPEHPLPLFLVEHDEPGVGEAWETTVTSSRILKTSILVVTASLIAFLLVENPATLFANVMALLIDKSALRQRSIDANHSISLRHSGFAADSKKRADAR